MAGFGHLTIDEYKARFKDGGEAHLLLDVRTIEEFEDVHIPGAVNIPLDELDDRTQEVVELANELPVVVVCKSGGRSVTASNILVGAQLPLTIYNLKTGTMGWVDAGHPVGE